MLWAIKVTYHWKNPSVNFSASQNIHNCIHTSNNKGITLTSMGQPLQVNYVTNTNKSCVNPYFPAIHMSAQKEHNTWLHIMHTDAKPMKLQRFIDYDKTYPFYTLEHDFYDAPDWNYTLFSKPLSYWKGHAYAVEVNHLNKTIKCLGGIEWEFKLSHFQLHPQMIALSSLSINDWEKDWETFKHGLEEYSHIK